MQEKTLKTVASAAAAIGIAALGLLTLIQPETADWVREEDAGETITIEGEVVSSDTRSSVTFVEVELRQRIRVIVFDELYIPSGRIIVTGEVGDGHEIIADSISYR